MLRIEASSFSDIPRSSPNVTSFSAVFMQILSLFSFAVFLKRLKIVVSAGISKDRKALEENHATEDMLWQAFQSG